MSTKTPLREQTLGYRPRILVNVSTLGKYHVEYIGQITHEHCGTSYPTLEAAMDYAWIVGARHALRSAA